MEFTLYKRRHLSTHSYIVPTYFYPIAYYVGTLFKLTDELNGCAISVFFLALLQSFMFLSSFWGSEVYVFSRLQRVRRESETEIVKVSKSSPNQAPKVGFARVLERTAVVKSRKETVRYFEFDHEIFYFKEGASIQRLSINTEIPIDRYFQESPHKEMLTETERVIFPKNVFKIDPPAFTKMFAEHAVSPFFVFQIFCALLWMLDEYWKYSLFTFFTIILFEGGMVFQRYTNIKQLRTLNLKPQNISKNNGGKKESVLSTELMPGDRVFLSGKMEVPADLLILSGEAVVNESMLSGEAVPVQKESVQNLKNSKKSFLLSHHRKHVLFAGTKVLKCSDKGVECVVIRTGFMSEQGVLIRSMIASEDTVSENNFEAYLFILAMLVFAVGSCAYVVRESLKMGKTLYKIGLECIMILTNVVPPELPMELTIAVNSSLQELVSLGVYCLEPFRIPFAGRITTCCFDKTGTLTELNLHLERVEAQDKGLADVVLGTCHSLVLLEGVPEGDHLDTCGFEFVGGNLIRDDFVEVRGKEYSLLRRFSFDSALKRATAVIENQGQKYVVMKGAPETVREYLKSLPEGYEKYEEFADAGYRVIALAAKPLQDLPAKREKIEAEMDFVGFALYISKLKESAKSTVSHLMQSGHRVIMITGDNERTAISVAKQLGMFNGKFVSGSKKIAEFLKEAKSGAVWPSVFARADPDAKEKTLSLLNALGEYTLMCGDGTNDVGALKTAHAGIALLEKTVTKAKAITLPGNIGQSMFILDEEVKVKLGDASIAAPFTSRTGSLESVIHVISRGRSALVSTVQMYKVLALNCLLSAYTLSVFDTMGIKYGDLQMTAAGLLSAVSFTFFGKSRPLQRISREKPVAKIFSPYIVCSVVLQTVVHILSFCAVYRGVVRHENITMQEKFEPSLGNTAMFLLGAALQVTTLVVNYVGRPFRESLTENRKLLNSLLASLAMVAACTLEIAPEFNEQMQLVRIPADLKMRLLLVMAGDFAACFAIERGSFGLFMRGPRESSGKEKKE
ncbi:manganese-transporting P-type ATPase [Nematocida major]|uniref:manganese-transporting P-type ATPase n=1 Tax=Nematocida major TaxID=1912982 RepID=UPI0020077FB3|nr:manganese-transporting P-type ATPase [Nematocida major]KAH9387422.1 manganese-transporting P-type ATPase [Nematocida major]